MKILKKAAAVFTAAVIMLSCAACNSDTESVPVSSGGQTTQSVSTEGSAQQTDDTPSAADTTVSQTIADTVSSQTTADTSPADTTVSQTTTAATTSATNAQTTASQPVEQKPTEPASGVTVQYNISNSWEEGGMACTQIDFTVLNNSGSAISGWKLDISLGQQTEIMQSWNVSASANGSGFTASNVDYNKDIAAGSNTTFGCIVKTTSAVSSIASVRVNDSGASVSGGSTQPAVTTTNAQNTTQPSVGDIEVTGKFGLVSDIGQLSVKGVNLVGADGEPVQLRGISTHGIQWFPAFANKDCFRYLRDEWNINVIRLAMYSGAGEGYTDSTKAQIEQTVQNAVDACIELDMYVIVDWHVLADQSPQVRKSDALRFFGYMSEKYADYPNIIYEICNEPNGYASWGGDVKPYANEVIPVIRANDPDSVVIVGTPTWCQDIDKALADPLEYDNIMYALHYYAATHTDWLRDRMKKCYNGGLPIIVSEFGNCDASGNGSNNLGEARKWLELMDSLGISYMNWSLCDKSEAASLLMPGASATGGWSDSQLTENGRFMRDWFRDHE